MLAFVRHFVQKGREDIKSIGRLQLRQHAMFMRHLLSLYLLPNRSDKCFAGLGPYLKGRYARRGTEGGHALSLTVLTEGAGEGSTTAMIRLNYETRSDIIQAIFMAESDDFKKVLLEEFPEVFEREAVNG